MGSEFHFQASLYLLASNMPHILNVALDVPDEVSLALGRRGYVHVRGTADGEPLKATLVPTGGGRHRRSCSRRGGGGWPEPGCAQELTTTPIFPTARPEIERSQASGSASRG